MNTIAFFDTVTIIAVVITVVIVVVAVAVTVADGIDATLEIDRRDVPEIGLK